EAGSSKSRGCFARNVSGQWERRLLRVPESRAATHDFATGGSVRNRTRSYLNGTDRPRSGRATWLKIQVRRTRRVMLELPVEICYAMRRSRANCGRITFERRTFSRTRTFGGASV